MWGVNASWEPSTTGELESLDKCTSFLNSPGGDSEIRSTLFPRGSLRWSPSSSLMSLYWLLSFLFTFSSFVFHGISSRRRSAPKSLSQALLGGEPKLSQILISTSVLVLSVQFSKCEFPGDADAVGLGKHKLGTTGLASK